MVWSGGEGVAADAEVAAVGGIVRAGRLKRRAITYRQPKGCSEFF